MNATTYALCNEFKPELLVTIYRNGGQYYLESHDITEKGEVMAGKPLQQTVIQEMVDVFFDEKKNKSEITGFMHGNLLSYQSLPGGQYKLVWFRPAEKRIIHHVAALKLPSGKTWVPAMVYSVERDRLSVYALSADERPLPVTRLYYAPFFNVSDSGEVCLGNAKVSKPKEKTFNSVIKYWEDLFWLSVFSHVNGEQKVKSKDLKEVWHKMLKSKCKLKWEDINELKLSKQTVQSIL